MDMATHVKQSTGDFVIQKEPEESPHGCVVIVGQLYSLHSGGFQVLEQH